MAGGPASEIIMFVAAVVAAGLIAGSLSAVAGELSDGMAARADVLGEQLQGRFAIVNDPAAMPYVDPDLTLYVKNTGRIDLYLGNFVVLIDGQASNDLTFLVDGSPAEMLAPGELVEITVGDAVGLGGDHVVSVIASNSHKQSMEFNV